MGQAGGVAEARPARTLARRRDGRGGHPAGRGQTNRAITPRGRTFGRASMCLLSFPANDPPSGFANTQPIADDDESGAEMGRARVEWATLAARPLFSSDDHNSANCAPACSFRHLMKSAAAGPLSRGTSSDVWRPGGPRGGHTPSRARYPRCSPLRRFPRASAPSRSSARVPARVLAAPARGGRHAIRASSDDLDGADAGPADDGMTGNPLFTPDFKKAFMEAQERIEAREAPDRARIDAEVAEIMARVETERELESQLPEDDEPPEPEPSSPSVARERVEEEYGGALNNPLFTPEFKEAFIQAQERIAEREAPMRAE